MVFSTIIKDYSRWHYTHAWKELFGVWLNFLWFVIHYFSIPQLFRSLFAPWKRITEDRGQKFNFEDLAAYIIINIFSRVIGALLRSIILITGLTVLSLVITIGACTFVLWLVAPLLIVGGLVFGIGTLASHLII